MDIHLGHTRSAFMGFFAIMIPVVSTAVFVGLTAEDDADTRRKGAPALPALTSS